MRTAVISVGSGLVAAVAAAFIALAIDDGGTTVIEQAAPATEVVADSPLVSNTLEPEPAATEVPAARVDDPVVVNAFDPVQIFQTVEGSVVSVLTPEGGGSGFFIDDAGHVITNYHVVQGHDEVSIVLSDGTSVTGRVLGFDSANDLAVVEIDATGMVITPVRLGDSSALVVGEPVVAIGNPFGLERTLTTGVVSAVGRVQPPLLDGGRAQRGLIQTDASVNPGNSGGPLINQAGEVIGVNVSAQSPIRGSVGVNFAIPIALVERFLPDLIAGEVIQHPWIGIAGAAADSEAGLPIGDVVADGPAAQAGLQAGDRIVAVAGVNLDSFDALAELIDQRSVGETVPFAVQRGAERLDIAVTLASWPA